MESNRHQGDVHMSPFPFEYYKFGWQSAIINKVPFKLPFLTLRFLHESEASSFDLMKTSMILLMLSHYLPRDSQHSSLYKNLVLISTTHCMMLTFIASPSKLRQHTVFGPHTWKLYQKDPMKGSCGSVTYRWCFLFFSTSRDGFMLVVAWALSWWFIHLVIFYLQLLLEGWVCFSYCFDHDRNMIKYIYINM